MSQGIDLSGLARGIQQYAINQERASYIQDMQNQQELMTNQKFLKEQEQAKKKIDSANAKSFLLESKTNLLLDLNNSAENALGESDPQKAQETLFKSVDDVYNNYSRIAPNGIAKDNIKQITEGFKQSSIGKFSQRFAQNTQRNRNFAYSKADTDTIQAVRDGKMPWFDAVVNAQENAVLASEFMPPEMVQQKYDETVKNSKKAQFDYLIGQNDLEGADALLKDSAYKTGLGQDIIDAQAKTFKNALVRDKQFRSADPVGWLQQKNPVATIQDIINTQAEMGIPPEKASVLSTEQAVQTVQDFKNATTEDSFIQLLNETKQKGGSFTRNLLNDLNVRGKMPPALNYAFKFDAQQDAETISLLYDTFRMGKDFNENFKQAKIKNALDEKDFASQVLNGITELSQSFINEGTQDTTELSNATLTIAKAHYLKYNDSDKAIEFATSEMTKGFKFVDIENNNKIARIPDIYDETDIKIGLSQIKNDIKIPVKTGNSYFDRIMPDVLKESNTYWASNETGTGLFLMDVDTQRPIEDETGNFFEYSYEDIMARADKHNKEFNAMPNYGRTLGGQ
jgi:hypothetical protein